MAKKNPSAIEISAIWKPVIWMPAIWIVMFVSIAACSKKSGPDVPAPGPVMHTPHITSFSPASASLGDTVTLQGMDFSTTASENIVTFRGKTASVLEASATTLKVKVPVGARDGKIAVRIGDRSDSSGDVFNYIFTVSTLAGNGNNGFVDGPGNQARFSYDTYGVAADAAGNVYVADGSNNCIRKITPEGVVSTLAGDTIIGNRDGTGKDARFNYPHGLAVDGSGNIFVADAANNLIRKIAPAGVVTTVAGSGAKGLTNGTGIAAAFDFPADLVIDGVGNLYVSDGNNRCIRKIAPNREVTTFATGFGFPEGITMDVAGNLFVADAGSGVIRKVTPAGVVSVLTGSLARRDHVDGKLADALFHTPEGIAIDKDGNLYVGELYPAIRRISPDGIVSTIAGSGTINFLDARGLNARFGEPSGVAVDGAGNIFIADVVNLRIRKLQ